MVEGVPTLPDAIRAGFPPEAVLYVAALEAIVATVPTLTATITALQERVAALEARLAQSSRNSSRPPSTDPPGTPRGSPPATGRLPGGQRGHPGAFRVLRPPLAVDAVVVCVPEQCAGCGAALPAPAAATDPADERRQVTEVPVVAATVTEYRLAARRCADCGHLTRAPLPAGVAPTGFGPRLTALVALLTGRYRLSKREAAQCLADLYEVDLAVGSVTALEQTTSRALAPVVAEARTAVQQAPVANLDETRWRQGRRGAWLWTVVTATLTIFHLDPSRAGAVARMLLGPAWAGVVGSDRGTMYAWLPVDRRQVCWAHLKRDFQKLVDWGPASRPTGQHLLAVEAQVFTLWHRFRRGEIDRATLVQELVPVQTTMRQILAEGSAGPTGKAAGVCWALLHLWPALWTFAQVGGVDPTNNAAERALRPAVLWRKGSFGTHSADGSRFVERVLTVTATCRQQGRRVMDVLVAAVTAAQQGQPPPSLLPSPT